MKREDAITSTGCHYRFADNAQDPPDPARAGILHARDEMNRKHCMLYECERRGDSVREVENQ